jgi:aryl-alcohol dehydrogenase-like predicted oxidoreductase
MASYERGILGRTGIEVGRLGMAASYGVPAEAVERAFEHGVNYLYWGSLRTRAFERALKNLAQKRDRVVLVIQSYTRIASLMAWSLERALRRIGYDRADLLLLGMWNRRVPPRILDAAHRLKERGLVRRLGVSTHRRPSVARWAGDFDVFHVRYNAVHTGAERDVFPLIAAADRPGIVTFTSTCWRRLLDPRRVPKGDRAPSATDCYRFAMSNPAVDVCMSGPATAAQAEEALAALRLGPMSAEEMAWMRRVGAAVGARRSPGAVVGLR